MSDYLSNWIRKMSKWVTGSKRPTALLFAVMLLGFSGYLSSLHTLHRTVGSLWQLEGVRTAISSILAVLVAFVGATVWVLNRNSHLAELISKYRWFIWAVVILALGIPPIAFFIMSTSASLIWLTTYLRELLTTLALAVSSCITLMVLRQLGQDKDRIREQRISWKKWLEGDTSGWHELWEEICFGKGLHPLVHLAVHVERMLGRVLRKRSAPHINGYTRETLLRLLLLSPVKVSKLSEDEPIPEREIESPGYIHTQAFIDLILSKMQRAARDVQAQ